MQRWALQAVREDAAPARRDIAERRSLAGRGRRSGARRSTRFLADARRDARRRLGAFMRTLSREGEPDLAGLALAVRQLRSLVT